MQRQVARLCEVAAAAGSRLTHVKPHGALYHRVTGDAEAARALVVAVAALDPGLAIVGFPDSQVLLAARRLGALAIVEGFADRRYGQDGRLVSRQEKDARLEEKEAVAQALRLAGEGRVGTICLHSDAPGAAALATAVRRALMEASFAIAPFGPFAARPARGHR